MHTRPSPPTGSLTTGGQSCSRSWHLWWPADQTVRASSSRTRSQSLKRGAQRGARTRASQLRACTPQHRRRSRARRPQGGMRREIGIPPKRVRYGVRTQDRAQAMAAAAGRRAALCCGCCWCDRSGATEVWRLSLKYGVCRHGLDGDSEPELELWGSPVLTCKKGTSYTPCTSAAAR